MTDVGETWNFLMWVSNDGRASHVVLATSEVRGLEVRLAVQLVAKPAAQLEVHN